MEPTILNPAYTIINLLLWLFFLFFFLTPILRRHALNKARETLIRMLEEKLQSRVITLIHRQESVGFFGIPIIRYINIEDSEQVLRAIRLTPPEMPIVLIIHTPGGSQQFFDFLLKPCYVYLCG